MKSSPAIYLFIFSISVFQISFSQHSQDKLLGKWVLNTTVGGITGRGVAFSDKIVIEFTSACSYNLYQNDSLISSKSFELRKVVPRYSATRIKKRNQKIKREMLFLSSGTTRQLIQVSDSTLVLRQDAADGLTSVYKKVLPKPTDN